MSTTLPGLLKSWIVILLSQLASHCYRANNCASSTTSTNGWIFGAWTVWVSPRAPGFFFGSCMHNSAKCKTSEWSVIHISECDDKYIHSQPGSSFWKTFTNHREPWLQWVWMVQSCSMSKCAARGRWCGFLIVNSYIDGCRDLMNWMRIFSYSIKQLWTTDTIRITNL